MQKSGLRTAAEILILVGAILSTIIQAILILVTFFIWTIPAIVIIVFAWVNRSQALKGSRGFTICGIVFSAFTDTLGLIGYILLLVDNINNPVPEAEVVSEKEVVSETNAIESNEDDSSYGVFED